MNRTAHTPIECSPDQLPAWVTLKKLSECKPHLRELLSEPDRVVNFKASACGLELDFSRQRLSQCVLNALLELATQSGLEECRDAMFSGTHINTTESRPVLHVALRGTNAPHQPWGQQVQSVIKTALDRFCEFARCVREGLVLGHSGKPITDVINVGIGGSDLGPKMAHQALSSLVSNTCRVHFISNPDAWNLFSLLQKLDAATTLVIVSSKTFTTQETLTNAQTLKEWLLHSGCPESRLADHLVAVTASPEKAAQLGYKSELTFPFWDWVGGRYSLWSAIGLPLAIAVGPQAFRSMLEGAQAMDEHFCQAPLSRNLPVLMAMTGIWNRNFLDIPTTTMAVYSSRLAQIVPFVQQMDMESNGKSTHRNHLTCTVSTGPIVWGGLGIDGQHAYFQLLHQGTHPVSMEFIGVRNDDTPIPRAQEHHRVVTANLLAQAHSLALGRTIEETRHELIASGLSHAQAASLVEHRNFRGNVPSNILWLDELNPFQLGALIAAYEHKVFTQACVWNTHAFDQWGVELGKKVVHRIYEELAP